MRLSPQYLYVDSTPRSREEPLIHEHQPIFQLFKKMIQNTVNWEIKGAVFLGGAVGVGGDSTFKLR